MSACSGNCNQGRNCDCAGDGITSRPADFVVLWLCLAIAVLAVLATIGAFDK